MMKRLITKLFVENAALKAFSLVLALALVVLVRGERDAVTATSVNVVWTAPTDRVLMNDPVDRVRVSVAGPLSKVNRLDQRDVPPIRVELAKVYAAEFVFSGTMIELPPGLRVVSISPPSTSLRFDKRIAKNVPVRPKIKGIPAAHFLIDGEPTAIPSEVVIEGAKSVVDQIDHVDTELVDIGGSLASLTREARLASMPRYVEVRAAPVVRVAVRIMPEPIDRVFAGVVVRGGDPSLVIEPHTVEVKLRGQKRELDRLSPASIAVNLAAGEGPGKRAVELTGLPSAVTLLSIQPEEVTVAAPPPPKP